MRASVNGDAAAGAGKLSRRDVTRVQWSSGLTGRGQRDPAAPRDPSSPFPFRCLPLSPAPPPALCLCCYDVQPQHSAAAAAEVQQTGRTNAPYGCRLSAGPGINIPLDHSELLSEYHLILRKALNV